MLKHFTYNGTSTADLGLIVNGINIYGSPSRVVEKVQVPYRNGDLLIDTGAYNNYMLTYTVSIVDNTKAKAEAISAWLLAPKGYHTLTDTYNPEIYRIATYYNQLDYTLSMLYRYGQASISFDCKPQKYLANPTPISLSSTLSEETSYSLSTPAMPLPITLEGNTTQGENPTPEAPQEIHSVSGDNEIRVVGFNIWDEVTANGYYGANGVFVANASYIAGKNKIPLLPSTQYCITSLKGNLGRICFYNADGTFNSTIVNYVGATVTKYTFTTNADVYFMAFDMRSGYGTTYANDICINVSDTENGTYEPYKAQIYPINLPVENQISTDYSAFTVGSNYAQYLTRGDTVTLSLTDKDTSVDISGIYVGMLKSLADSTAGYYWVVLNGNVQAKKYTTSQYKYFTIYPKDENTWARILARFDVQVEVGSVANHYTPYGVAPIELNALGNYKDYFHKTNGKWYLHKETGTADIGSLTWAKGSTSYYTNTLATVFKIPSQTETPKIMSSIGMIPKSANAVSGVAGSNEAYINTLGQLIYYFSMSKYASATEFMNAMKGQMMIYQATPTETEITDTTLISQLNALSKAKTYDGSTTIVQEGTDAQFKLSMPVPAEVTSEYKGEPIITVSEVGTIVWNDSLIKVNSAPVTINSQTLQCYYYSENKNNDVEINEFPKYEQRENYIGSTMALTVVPNYWKL